MRTFELNSNDINAITVALKNRIEDLQRFADTCARDGQHICANELMSMAEQCEKTLKKFEA